MLYISVRTTLYFRQHFGKIKSVEGKKAYKNTSVSTSLEMYLLSLSFTQLILCILCILKLFVLQCDEFKKKKTYINYI